MPSILGGIDNHQEARDSGTNHHQEAKNSGTNHHHQETRDCGTNNHHQKAGDSGTNHHHQEARDYGTNHHPQKAGDFGIKWLANCVTYSCSNEILELLLSTSHKSVGFSSSFKNGNAVSAWRA